MIIVLIIFVIWEIEHLQYFVLFGPVRGRIFLLSFLKWIVSRGEVKIKAFNPAPFLFVDSSFITRYISRKLCVFLELFKEIFNTVYNVEGLIKWAGYVGLFAIIFAETGLLIGFFLPGDSLLVTAGLFAATGELNILYLNLLLIPAAILGNSLGYWIGLKSGPKLFKREQSLLFRKDYLIKTHNYFEKHGAPVLIVTRFMPILRTFSPVVAGIGEMDYKKFFYFNVIGAFAWISSLSLIGYFLGRTIPNIDKHIEKVILVVIFLSMLPAIIKFVKHRLIKKKPHDETEK